MNLMPLEIQPGESERDFELFKLFIQGKSHRDLAECASVSLRTIQRISKKNKWMKRRMLALSLQEANDYTSETGKVLSGSHAYNQAIANLCYMANIFFEDLPLLLSHGAADLEDSRLGAKLKLIRDFANTAKRLSEVNNLYGSGYISAFIKKADEELYGKEEE